MHRDRQTHMHILMRTHAEGGKRGEKRDIDQCTHTKQPAKKKKKEKEKDI